MNKLAQLRLDRLNQMHSFVKGDDAATVLDCGAQPGWMNASDWNFVQLAKAQLRIEELEHALAHCGCFAKEAAADCPRAGADE